ncbi:MAG: hypothetical protein ABG776_14645, partial [Cyanobacteria bacterium J06555_13]
MSKLTKNRRLHSAIAGAIATLELSLGTAKAKATTDVVPEPILTEQSDNLDFSSDPGADADEPEGFDSLKSEADGIEFDTARMTAIEVNTPVTTSLAKADFSFIAVDDPETLLTPLQDTKVAKPPEPVLLSFSVEDNESAFQPLETFIALGIEDEDAVEDTVPEDNTQTDVATLLALVPEEDSANANRSATLLALISALDDTNGSIEVTAEMTQTLLALISEEIEAQTNAETVSTLLALVAALEEEEAPTAANAETTSVLLALISDLESGNIEAAKRAATLLSLRLDLEEEDTSQKAPWLASSLSVEAASAEPVNTGDALQIALRSPDAPSAQFDKPTEPWLALADLDNDPEETRRAGEPWIAFAIDDEGNETQKAPWLARANPSAEESQNPEADDNLLSINLQQSEPGKRSAAWISLTPIELTAPGDSSNDTDVAVNISATRQGADAY